MAVYVDLSVVKQLIAEQEEHDDGGQLVDGEVAAELLGVLAGASQSRHRPVVHMCED